MAPRYGNGSNGHANGSGGTIKTTTTDNVVAPSRWSTEPSSNEYDPDKFYTKATDGNGHSSEARVKIPPAMAGQVQALIEQKEVPAYRKAADFWRDAGVHNLNRLKERNFLSSNEELRVDELLSSFEAQREIDAINRELDYIEVHRQEMERTIDRLIHAEDFAWADELIRADRRRASEWGNPHRERQLRLLNRLDVKVTKASAEKAS